MDDPEWAQHEAELAAACPMTRSWVALLVLSELVDRPNSKTFTIYRPEEHS